MNAIPLFFDLLRRTAIGCAALIAFVILLIVGSVLWGLRLDSQHSALANDRLQRMSQIEAAEAKIQLMTQGQVFLERSARAGLMGPARREEWIQALIAAHERLGLKGTPTFKLGKPQRLTPTTTAATGSDQASTMMSSSTSPTTGETLDVYGHMLEFKLQGVHEGEVLAILSSLLSAYPDIQKPGGCVLTEPRPTGLTAECSVRFFNIAPPSVNASTPVAPTVPMSGKS